MSNTSIAVAFPVITSSFNTSLVMAGWVLSISSLVGAAVMPLAGKLGEIYGTKRVYLTALGLFTFGSLLCAMAPNIQLLIFFRFIQAAGMNCFLPLTVSIIASEFPQNRQRALGLLTSTFTIGMLVGPNLGGWLVSAYGWASVFWLNVPLGICLFTGAMLLLRAKPGEKSGLDLLGVGLLTGALFALIAGFTELQDLTGINWVIPAALFVTAVIMMILFLRHERTCKNQIMDMNLLTLKPFIGSNIFNFMTGFLSIGAMSFIPLYMVSIYGKTTLESGILLTWRSVGTMIAAFMTSIFMTRWGYRRPMLAGVMVNIICMLLFSLNLKYVNLAGIHLSSTVWISLLLFTTGVGQGLYSPVSDVVCVDLMPERAGVISGMKGMFRQTGAAMAVAISSLVLDRINSAAGFSIVFLIVVGLLVIVAPSVFMMPKNHTSR
jgi:EmrB/QacA subfamily drug resistance transporter